MIPLVKDEEYFVNVISVALPRWLLSTVTYSLIKQAIYRSRRHFINSAGLDMNTNVFCDVSMLDTKLLSFS